MGESQDSPETGVTGSSTVDGGQPTDSVEKPADPVKRALDGARHLARGAGASRSVRSRQRRRAGNRDGTDAPVDPSAERRGGLSGPGPDRSDPVLVGELLTSYLGDRGWQRPLDEARLFSDWAAIVGSDVAAHCAPAGLHDGELRVAAESTAWATQLRLLAGSLLARIVAEIGPDIVQRLTVTGPTAPSWKHGRFSVRGARGPRDTYG